MASDASMSTPLLSVQDDSGIGCIKHPVTLTLPQGVQVLPTFSQELIGCTRLCSWDGRSSDDPPKVGAVLGRRVLDYSQAELILEAKLHPLKVEQWLVMWKDQAAVHSQWLTEQRVNQVDPTGFARKRREWQKTETRLTSVAKSVDPSQGRVCDSYYKPHPYGTGALVPARVWEAVSDNQLHYTIDRIVASEFWVASDDGQVATVDSAYRVKWCDLPYTKTTWERDALVRAMHPAAVERYERSSKPPSVQNTVEKPKSKGFQGCIEAAKPTESQLLDLLKLPPDLKLLPHQVYGVWWMLDRAFNEAPAKAAGSLLADEMGLGTYSCTCSTAVAPQSANSTSVRLYLMITGKTVQVAVFLRYLYQVGNHRGPYLVVVPVSVLPHWRHELELWSELNTVVYHGPAEELEAIYDTEFQYNSDDHKGMYKFHVLVTTPQVLISEYATLGKIEWAVVVLDEAHGMKNRQASITKCVRSLTHKHIILLTGTPVQNNLEELHTLLSIIDPGTFSSRQQFLNRYQGKLASRQPCPSQIKALRRLMLSYMLLRTKADIDSPLPKCTNIVLLLRMTYQQNQLYDGLVLDVLNRSGERSHATGSPEQSRSSGGMYMGLRQCCQSSLVGKQPSDQTMSEEELCNELLQNSCKVAALAKLLKHLSSNGHRVLIFSQMTQVLNLIETIVRHERYEYERIDGSTSSNHRQQAVGRFNAPDSRKFMFLISTRSGCNGLNLQSADTVVIFDPDWNPQNDQQAKARAHRFGQTKNVTIYSLLTADSYDITMSGVARDKSKLNAAIMHSRVPWMHGAAVYDDAVFNMVCDKLDRRTTHLDINDPSLWSAVAAQLDTTLVLQDECQQRQGTETRGLPRQVGSNKHAAVVQFAASHRDRKRRHNSDSK